MLAGLFLGRARMMRLMRRSVPIPENPPEVTILIPAKDEVRSIRCCIDSVLAQDYSNFDVIAVDDRSRDVTGQILDETARETSRLHVIHIAPGALPDGWLGKCNCALDRLARSPRAMAVVRRFGCDHFARRTFESDCAGSAAKLRRAEHTHAAGVPHFLGTANAATGRVAAWAVMFAASLTNEDSRQDIAAANGQFLLIRRHAYESVGGHESAKTRSPKTLS